MGLHHCAFDLLSSYQQLTEAVSLWPESHADATSLFCQAQMTRKRMLSRMHCSARSGPLSALDIKAWHLKSLLSITK